MVGLIGKKLGMTRIFTEDGISIPITVIKIEKNRIIQVKDLNSDRYCSIQVTTGTKKINRIKKSEIGHFTKANTEVGRILYEFRLNKNEKFNIGQIIDVSLFNNIKKVDITGTSKGKGFSGTVKRWNFSTQDATHGNSLSHRVPGSIGQNQTPGRVFKGKKMAGQLGNKRVTIQNLNLIRVDTKRNLLLIKGSTPGANGNDVIIRPSIKVE